MAIEDIEMEGPEARVSDTVARLIEPCSRGWERFFADNDDHQAPRFVPSVPERVFAVLEEVTTPNLPPRRLLGGRGRERCWWCITRTRTSAYFGKCRGIVPVVQVRLRWDKLLWSRRAEAGVMGQPCPRTLPDMRQAYTSGHVDTVV